MRKDKELRMLLAMRRYYLGEFTSQRAAEEAGVGLYELVELVRRYDLRLADSAEDVRLGLERVDKLLEKYGVKGVLKYAKELRP